MAIPTQRNPLIFVVVILCGLAYLQFLTSQREDKPAPLAMGDGQNPTVHAPALSFTELIGAPATMMSGGHALQGRIIVLDFWATWCAPCVAAVPELNALVARFGGEPDGAVFFSVTTEARGEVEKFIERKPLASIVALDGNGDTFAAYGVNAIPRLVVIDRNGGLVLRTASLAEVAATLEHLLAAPAAVSDEMETTAPNAP